MTLPADTFYGTADGFTAYCVGRGYIVPDGIESNDIEAALVVASQWLDGTYRYAFMAPFKNGFLVLAYGEGMAGSDVGTYKTGARAQVLEWPRTGFVDTYGDPIAADEIPRVIEMSAYEAAFRQIVAPGSLQIDYSVSKYSRVQITGAIDVTYKAGASAADVQPQIPIIDGILSALLGATQSYNSSGLSGAVVRT